MTQAERIQRDAERMALYALTQRDYAAGKRDARFYSIVMAMPREEQTMLCWWLGGAEPAGCMGELQQWIELRKLRLASFPPVPSIN
jgi:hypothetical protein